MYLEPHEIERFYSIWFPLLHYVNQHLHVVPHFPQEWKGAGVDTQVAVDVRNAMWEHDALRESFIAENPAQLSEADLAIVDSWKHRVSGNFFIFRHLKKHTVFLNEGRPSRAYGVLGITGPLEEIVGPYLPIYVQAVLIPFEERIIYDSLLSSYPIHFGGGIRESLNHTYRDIQERSGVTLTLLPDTQRDSEAIKKDIQARNDKVLKAFQKDLGRSGLSPKKIEEHTNNITEFAQEFLLSRDKLYGVLDMTIADLEAYFSLKKKPNHVSFKRFVRFLQDSMRMDWDEAEEFLGFIKEQRS